MKNKPLKIIDEIECYVDEESASYYPADDYYWLHKIEDNHFWFKARRKIIKILFDKYATDKINSNNVSKLLEVGCGTGGNLKMFSKYKNLEVTGGEMSLNYLRFIKNNIPAISLVQIDATALPYKDYFDIICAFDVIEHIDNDHAVINATCDALTDNGVFLITVPQHNWLWSAYDKKALHKRRYSKKDLIEKLTKASFKISYCGSFMFTLLPVMLLHRFTKKNKINEGEKNEFTMSNTLNAVLYLFMKFDIFLIKNGMILPWGGSLIVIARKK